MKFSKRVKELMYKGVSLVLMMAVLAGVVMIPPKSSKAAVKTYRDNLVLEQGEGWWYYGLSSADSWKSSKPEVAIADMYGSIYGMKVGKATMTGKDRNNNKYIVKVTVIKPIHFQIKKVQVTKTSLKYTVKNLNKKAVKFEKKARCWDSDDATVSHDCKLKKTVTIKPKKTATIEINTKDNWNFSYNGKRNFSSASINIVYDKKKLEYSFEPKAVKNTRKNVTKFSCFSTYYIDKGQKGNVCLLNNTKKVTWSVLSGNKYISIEKKTNHYAVIKAKAVGTAKIQAKVGNKKYTCVIEVDNAYDDDDFYCDDDYDDDDDYYDDDDDDEDDSDDSYYDDDDDSDDDDGYYDDEDYSDDDE